MSGLFNVGDVFDGRCVVRLVEARLLDGSDLQVLATEIDGWTAEYVAHLQREYAETQEMREEGERIRERAGQDTEKLRSFASILGWPDDCRFVCDLDKGDQTVVTSILLHWGVGLLRPDDGWGDDGWADDGPDDEDSPSPQCAAPRSPPVAQ